MFAAAASSWALVGLEDVKFDGSLEINGNSAKNETDYNDSGNDRRGGANTRVRLGVNATVTEGVLGRVEFTRTGRQYGTGATTIAGEENLIQVQNAYIELADIFGVKAKIGRQYVGNANDLVWYIGPLNDDSLTVNAIDGLALSAGSKYVDVSLFMGKASEDDGLTNTDVDDAAGDVNLNSLDLVLPTLVPGGKVTLGYMWGVDKNTNASSDNNNLKIYRVGVSGGAMDNMVNYHAEYLMNDGALNGALNDTDYEGSAIDLGVGVNLKAAGDLALGINYVLASGDDNTTDTKDESFRDFSALTGSAVSDRFFGEIFGRDNSIAFGGPGVDTGAQGQGLEVINLSAAFTPEKWSKFSAKLDYYLFNQPEDSVNGANVGDKIGDEIDLTLGYKHTDNVKMEAGYAMLSPDDAITGVGAANDDTIQKWFARAIVKWGAAE